MAHELVEKAERIRRRAVIAPPRLYRCRFCQDTGYVIEEDHLDVDPLTQEAHRRPVAYPCPDADCERSRAMRAA